MFSPKSLLMKEIVIKPLKGKISLTLPFPTDFVSELNISDDDLMKCTVEDDILTIRKLVKRAGVVKNT